MTVIMNHDTIFAAIFHLTNEAVMELSLCTLLTAAMAMHTKDMMIRCFMPNVKTFTCCRRTQRDMVSLVLHHGDLVIVHKFNVWQLTQLINRLYYYKNDYRYIKIQFVAPVTTQYVQSSKNNAHASIQLNDNYSSNNKSTNHNIFAVTTCRVLLI